MIDWPDITRQYGPLVWKTAYRLLGNRTDAEDCYQEAFVSAVKFTRRRAVNDWPALLVHLATHRAIDLLRRNRKHRLGRGPDLPDDQTAPDATDPVQQAQANELAVQLRDAISRLSPSHGRLFSLRYVSGLTNQQIADMTGSEASHVSVKLYRIRQQLRKLLNVETADTERQVAL